MIEYADLKKYFYEFMIFGSIVMQFLFKPSLNRVYQTKKSRNYFMSIYCYTINSQGESTLLT